MDGAFDVLESLLRLVIGRLALGLGRDQPIVVGDKLGEVVAQHREADGFLTVGRDAAPDAL